MDSTCRVFGVPSINDWTELLALIAAIAAIWLAWKSLRSAIEKNASDIADLKAVVGRLDQVNISLASSLLVAGQQTVVMNSSLDALNQILAGSAKSQELAHSAHLTQIRPRFVQMSGLFQNSGQRWGLELTNVGADAIGVSVDGLPANVTAERNYTPNPLRGGVTQLSGLLSKPLTEPLSFAVIYADIEGNQYSQRITFGRYDVDRPIVEEPTLIAAK